MRPPSRRRRLAAAAALVGGGLASLLVATSPARAVTGVETGTWWAGNPLPQPASVPEGGLWVQQAPTGQTAVSALRLANEPGEIPQSIILTINTNGAPIGYSIKACLTLQSDWKPVQGGPLTDAPKDDCATFASVGQEATGKLVFDLTGLPARDVYSFVLLSGNVPVPTADPLLPAKPTAPYDVTFNKVTTADIQSPPAAIAPTGGTGDDSVSTPDDQTFFTPETFEPDSSFQTVTPSFFDPIETFAAPAPTAPRAAAPRAATPNGPAALPQSFVPAAESSTSRSVGRMAAAAAFLGLFAFGGVKAGGGGAGGLAIAGAPRERDHGGGKVSIYDWPPAPATLARPLRAFQHGRRRALGAGASQSATELEPVRVGKPPALR